MNHNLKITKNLILILFVSSLFIFLYRSLSLEIWAFGDLTRFSIIHPQNNPVYLWSDDGLGHTTLGTFWYYTIISIFNSAFKNYGHLFFHMSLLPLSLITFYYLSIKNGFKKETALLGAILYSINPVSISLFIMGEAGGLLIYVFQPLIFFIAYKIIVLNQDNLNNYLLFGLFSIPFFLNIHSSLLSFSTMLLLIGLVGLNKNISIWSLIMKFACICAIIILLIIPNIISYPIVYNKLKISNEITIGGYSYQDADFHNLIRLAGNKGSAQAKEFLNYNSVNNSNSFGYIIILVIVLPILSYKKKLKRYRETEYILIFLITLALIGLTILIKYNPELLSLNIFLSSLRNPIKIMYPLSILMSLLFMYGLEFIQKRFPIKYPFYFIIIFLMLMYYNSPALDGTLGLKKTRGDYFIDESYINLYNSNKAVFNDEKYRVLVLPWDYEIQKKTIWLTKNYFNPVSGSEIFGIKASPFKEIFEEMTYGNNTNNVVQLLSLMNIKYIMIYKNYTSNQNFIRKELELYDCIVFKESQTWRVSCNSNKLLKKSYELENYNINDIKKVYEDSNFIILQIINAKPKFYILQNDTSNFPLIPTIEDVNLLKYSSSEDNSWAAWPKNAAKFSNESSNNIITLTANDNFSSIYKTMKVEKDTLYTLRLNYTYDRFVKEPHIKLLWYNQTNDSRENASFKKDFAKLNLIDENEWNFIETKFVSPTEAKNVKVNLLIKNGTLSISEIYFNRYNSYLRYNQNMNQTVDYTKINPTLYKVKVNASKPFSMSFAESYDISWYARIDKINGTPVNSEIVRPVPLYSIINSFWINQTGDLEIIVEYEPQRWFYVSTAISLITFLLCVIYLVYDWGRNKRKEKDMRK